MNNTTKITISEKRFEALVRELGLLIKSASEAASSEKTRGYWEVGKRITEERLSEEAGYHNSVLRDVAQSLGVSARTLQRSVAFHRAYKKPPSDGLTWMHYQLLSSLEKKAERAFYQKRVAEEQWTVPELRDAIRADQFNGGAVEARILTRPTSLAYCYLARIERVIDGDTLDFDVDLGFRTWTKRRIRLAQIDAPESKTRAARAARDFVAQEFAYAKTIVLKSEKSDLYGRYLADVFISPETLPLEACFHSGRHLNELLVRHKHALVV